MSRSGRYLRLTTQSSLKSRLFGNPVEANAGALIRLLPEIRRYIYQELFGNQQIHVLDYNAGREGESLVEFGKMRKGKIPRLVHFICCPTPHKGPHEHNEYAHKWCQLSASLIFTCKQIYNEGVPVLYGCNRFMFDAPKDFTTLQSMTGHIFDYHFRKLGLVSSMLEFPALHEEILILAQMGPKDRTGLDIEIMLLEQNMAAGTFEKNIIEPLLEIDDELDPGNVDDGQARVIKLTFFLGNKTFPSASRQLQALEVSSHVINCFHDQYSRMTY